MYPVCSLSKNHRSNTIILCYHNITFLANADQLEVYRISSCSNCQNFAVIRLQNMIRVTQ